MQPFQFSRTGDLLSAYSAYRAADEGADAAPEPQAANVPAERQEESAAQRQPRPELAKAPDAWHQTRSEIEGTIK